MAAQASHSSGAGTHAMLPYLTIGGLIAGAAMLAAAFLTRNRRGRGARYAAADDRRYDRGRTIYRNTPMADVGFDTRGIP